MIGVKVLSLTIENIKGMNASFDIDSELAIIYGENRTGKTTVIEAMKYAFGGVRTKHAPKFLIGSSPSGLIDLVFGFSDSVYKITRKLYLDEEVVSLIKASKTLGEYTSFSKAKRKMVWSDPNSTKIIDREQTRIKGKNAENFANALKEIKLFPEIIDRLIAIENTQEFKFATKMFGSNTGGGYSEIKTLISKELQEKDVAIDMISKFSQATIDNLTTQSTSIESEHNQMTENLKNNFKKLNFKISGEDKMLDSLTLELAGNEKISNFNSFITLSLENTEKERDQLTEVFKNSEERRDKYIQLEELLEAVQFKKLESLVKEFNQNYAKVQEVQGLINNAYRNIENGPQEQVKIDFILDLSSFFREDILSLIKKEENLSLLEDTQEIVEIDSRLKSKITEFNDLIKNFNRYFELINIYKINLSEIDLFLMYLNNQLTSLENPAFLDLTRHEEIYNIYGKLEYDDITRERSLRLYMSINDLNRFYSSENVPKLDKTLKPFKTKESEKVPKNIVDSISVNIKLRIKELTELLELYKNRDELKKKLRNIIDDFDCLVSVLAKISGTIQEWDTYITGEIAKMIQFITKYSSVKSKKTSTIEGLEKALSTIKTAFIEEILNSMKLFKLKFSEDYSLVQNLESLELYLDALIKKKEHDIDIVRQIKEYILTTQQTYTDNCRKYSLNKDLHNEYIPVINEICAQIKVNIQLNKIEDDVMKDIKLLSEAFYNIITKESFLVLKEVKDEKNTYLKPYLRKPTGELEELLDSSPSGSEQAALGLGIMVSLAKMFKAFVVIDEVTDRFDYKTKIRFFEALKKFAPQIFLIFVLKVDVPEPELKQEYQRIKESFPTANFFQTVKKGMKMTVNEIHNFSDLDFSETINA